MHTVAARLGCKRAMVGIGWGNSHPGYINRFSHATLRGLIFGREGCLGSKQMFAN